MRTAKEDLSLVYSASGVGITTHHPISPLTACELQYEYPVYTPHSTPPPKPANSHQRVLAEKYGVPMLGMLQEVQNKTYVHGVGI